MMSMPAIFMGLRAFGPYWFGRQWAPVALTPCPPQI
jgi:hypothetical protein